jgi:hypothetical protein
VACCLACCILLVAGLFFVKVFLPSKAPAAAQAAVEGQAADDIDPEDPNVAWWLDVVGGFQRDPKGSKGG